MAKKPYYITTAIAYTSGKPHIGNTYEAVLADAIARFKRKQGSDVFFQTGTDEHGQKIQEKAQTAGVCEQAFVDGVAGEIKGIWDLVGTSYDKLCAPPTPITWSRWQKSLKNSTTKAIFTRATTKVCIVPLANPFGRKVNSWTANAPIAVGK